MKVYQNITCNPIPNWSFKKLLCRRECLRLYFLLKCNLLNGNMMQDGWKENNRIYPLPSYFYLRSTFLNISCNVEGLHACASLWHPKKQNCKTSSDMPACESTDMWESVQSIDALSEFLCKSHYLWEFKRMMSGSSTQAARPFYLFFPFFSVVVGMIFLRLFLFINWQTNLEAAVRANELQWISAEVSEPAY